MFFLKTKKRIAELTQSLDSANIIIKKLEKQNITASAILKSMVEGVIILDKDARIISCNTTVKQIFNIEKEEIIGKFFLEVVPNNDILELVSNVLEKKQYVSIEIDINWPLKKIFHINASPIIDNQKISGCFLVMHDITEIRKLETMRKDFVANVSHELKTPLTSIKGYIETLLDGAIEDKANSREFLKIIQEHSERLDSLISDLLELSSLESKEIKLNKQKIGLKYLVDSILLGFKAQIKNVDIRVEDNLENDFEISLDKERIQQVFINLIDNAIKFNRENGFIKIYNETKNDKIKIVIEDSGIGIPAKDIPRIFERFYRVDKARSRDLGGTGLGLSIVKHIIELHGGSVGVESTEGLGSKFYFYLPK